MMKMLSIFCVLGIHMSPAKLHYLDQPRHRPALDRADVAGWTPLHVAARMSRCTLVVILLKVERRDGDVAIHGRSEQTSCNQRYQSQSFGLYWLQLAVQGIMDHHKELLMICLMKSLNDLGILWLGL